MPPISLPNGCPTYTGAVDVGETTGGEETSALGTPKISNSSFTAALRSAVTDIGLASGSRYGLEAMIMKLDQPAFSYDTTVRLTVRYVLTDQATSTSVFDQAISSSFTAKHSSASKGGQRVHLANEGAARANIENALSALCEARAGP